ncbi:MAG TPA: flagellar basal body rod protein FlgB [Rhizomicrobium sp.]|nr:flagellar basal body rod protein FlgB [Rhizomicrobium sp.]
MNVADMPLFSLLKERLGWLNQRQATLSQNVANADTPGYSARDLKPINFEDVLKGATGSTQFHPTLQITDPRHIALKSDPSTSYQDQDSPDPGAAGGNTVSLEQEMIKVADTQAEYQAASNLYAKAIGMMKTAIGH